MIVQKKSKGSAVIKSKGRIDLSNSHLLEENLQALFDEGVKAVELDFSRVTGIDSSGLGKLLLFQKKFKECGGQFRIKNVTSKYIRKLFKMIHLYKVIDIEGIGEGKESE